MRYLLPLLGILGGAIPGNAQPPTSFGDTVVVSASLEGEKEEALPASIDVIEAREIEARQANSIADLLATATGLSVARSGGPGQVTSLFSRGTESDQVLVLWNGVELNNPYFGGFNWAFLPTDGVERIEVVRGPFSSLYGGEALGGVVQIRSAESEGGRLRLEAGEDGYWRAGLAAGGRFGKGRFDVAGHLRRGDGAVENEFFDGEDLLARGEWQVGRGVTAGVVARAADNEVGIPFSGGLPSPERRIAFEERELAVPIHAEVGDWSVRARLSTVTYDSRFEDPGDPFGFTVAETDSEALRVRAVASFRWADVGSVAIGVEHEQVEVDDRSAFGTNLAGESQETTALFGQLRRSVGRATVDVGVRYDDNDLFGSAVSPRVGVVFAAGRETRLWASFGEGFRPPSVGELFFPGSGNPDLEPETSESVELGLDRSFGRWRLGVVGFENRLEDLIDFDFVAFRNVNVGRARTRGVELEVDYRGERVSARWSGTLLEAEDRETGLDLLRRPEESASLVVTAEPGKWLLSLTGLYVGEREDVDPATFERTTNGVYVRADLAARREVTRRLSPYARIENLFDREYAEVLGFPAPGRTFVGGLAIGF